MNIKNLSKVLILSSALVLPAMAAELDPSTAATDQSLRSASSAPTYVMVGEERVEFDRLQARASVLTRNDVDTAFINAVKASYQGVVKHLLNPGLFSPLRVSSCGIKRALIHLIDSDDAYGVEWFLGIAGENLSKGAIKEALSAARARKLTAIIDILEPHSGEVAVADSAACAVGGGGGESAASLAGVSK